MVGLIFILTVICYGIALIFECMHQYYGTKAQRNIASVLERIGFSVFTVAICLLAYRSNQDPEFSTQYSFPWILFTWAMAGGHLLTDVLYKNRSSKISIFTWIIFVLVLFPSPSHPSLGGFLDGGVSWLSFHRLVFLLGYAFYFLGIPLLLSFFWTHVAHPFFFKRPKGAILEHQTRELDRIHSHLILWALPLLSLGIFTKILTWIESEAIIDAQTIWATSGEEFLAITAWFTCAIFLHARVFLRWKYSACASLYFAGLIVVIGAHLSGRFFLQIS